MSNKVRIGIVASLVLVFMFFLTGCGDDRKCLDYDTQVVATTTIINGKVVPGTTVVTTCVEYEKVKTNG